MPTPCNTRMIRLGRIYKKMECRMQDSIIPMIALKVLAVRKKYLRIHDWFNSVFKLDLSQIS